VSGDTRETREGSRSFGLKIWLVLAAIAKQAVSDLADVFTATCREARGKQETIPDGCQAALYALTCVLECFDDKDWIGMASYLEPQEMAGMK